MATATAPPPGSLLAEVEEIAALADPVERNIRITQLYHELELAVAEIFGSDDLSWCAYGVWASRQVGEAMQGLPVDYIRAMIDDPEFVDNLALPPDMDRWARRLVPVARQLPDRVLALVLDALQPHLAEALGRGNHRVFTELAPTFAGFVDLHREEDGDPDRVQARLPELYEQLGHTTYEGGAGYELTLLCDYYVRALQTDDPRERAQLVYYANLRGAHYEQQRVQGPLEEVTDVILEMPASIIGQSGAVGAVGRVISRVAPRTSHRVGHTIGAVLGNTTTDIAVRVSTPVDDLDVGAPLHPDPSGTYYPADLQQLELDEFDHFLRHPNNWMEPGPQPNHEVRVDNWVNYHERMPFIAHVMRMRQQSVALRLPPFEAAPGSETLDVGDVDLRGDAVADVGHVTGLG